MAGREERGREAEACCVCKLLGSVVGLQGSVVGGWIRVVRESLGAVIDRVIG